MGSFIGSLVCGGVRSEPTHQRWPAPFCGRSRASLDCLEKVLRTGVRASTSSASLGERQYRGVARRRSVPAETGHRRAPPPAGELRGRIRHFPSCLVCPSACWFFRPHLPVIQTTVEKASINTIRACWQVIYRMRSVIRWMRFSLDRFRCCRNMSINAMNTAITRSVSIKALRDMTLISAAT